MIVGLSSRALIDLDEIWLHVAEESGVEQADAVIDRLIACCRALDANPRRGRKRPEVVPGARSVFAAPWVVFYAIEGDEVHVLRVFHGRRDLATL